MAVRASSLDTGVRRWAPALVAAVAGLTFTALIGLVSSASPMALAIGLAVTLLVAWAAWRERGRRLESETMASRRMAELQRQVEAYDRAEARFRDFAEIASDWLWETDAEHRFTYVSENVAGGSGIPAAAYMGKRRSDPATLSVDAETARGFAADMEARLAFKDRITRRIRADGSVWYAKTSATPVFAADGTFQGYRGVSTNVTAEVTAQAAAEAAHKRLVEAIEILPAGIMIYDRDDRLVLANARVREMFPRGKGFFEPGTTRQAQLEFAIQAGVIPVAPERAEAWVRDRMATFRVSPAALIMPFTDGRWFQHIGRKTADGGTISVLIDVTELKRGEQELRQAKRQSDESLALLDTLQSAAPIGFAFIDREFRHVRVNEALAAINGLSAREHIGRTVEEVVPDLWPQVGPICARVLAEQLPVLNVEISGETPAKRGDLRHWLATFYPVRVGGGVIGVGMVAIEVSEQRRMEAQLRQAQKMEAIGNLTGGLAHDFNNLLGVVIGNLDLLCETEGVGAEVLELAGEARDASLRGADLTRRLLAFARRQPLQPRRVEANDLVTGAVKLLSRLLGEAVEISLDLAPELWPVVVDAAQLEASLANLATNARDAMPAGGSLAIATRNRVLDVGYVAEHPYVVEGDYVLIEVSDTGSGMPPEVLSRVFEPFFTTKEQGRGTGLGLSMVFGFMKQSGGHITVYSEVGVGSTIRLYFPRADGGVAAEELRLEEPALRGNDEVVLVVEDNAALRRVAVRQLAELGYRVREADSAHAAIEAIAVDAAVNVLFTDVIMPGGMDGRQLAEIVARRWPHIKALLTSGFPGSMVNGGRELAAKVRILSKPYRKDQLARALREVIERETGGSGEPAE
ncbi:MAG: PAS domain S-box protein [Stellaceae bacterium]